jgi:hypothetical protein
MGILAIVIYFKKAAHYAECRNDFQVRIFTLNDSANPNLLTKNIVSS